MEMISTDARASVLGSISTPNLSSSVYNQTTYPIGDKKNGSSVLPWLTPSKNILAVDELELRPFHNLPPRDPVDIQFKDVSYFVKSGFRRGKFALSH